MILHPLFLIETGTPRRDMSGWGFCIKLWPEWKELCARGYLDQQRVNNAIKCFHRGWLDACGFDAISDPHLSALDQLELKAKGKPIKYSKDAHPLYGEHSIRVTWGEWGLEHITVPGNACGLDIDHGIGAPLHGRVLLPHNVDNIRQAYLIQLVFNWFASAMVLEAEIQR